MGLTGQNISFGYLFLVESQGCRFQFTLNRPPCYFGGWLRELHSLNGVPVGGNGPPGSRKEQLGVSISVQATIPPDVTGGRAGVQQLELGVRDTG